MLFGYMVLVMRFFVVVVVCMYLCVWIRWYIYPWILKPLIWPKLYVLFAVQWWFYVADIGSKLWFKGGLPNLNIDFQRNRMISQGNERLYVEENWWFIYINKHKRRNKNWKYQPEDEHKMKWLRLNWWGLVMWVYDLCLCVCMCVCVCEILILYLV